MPQSVPRTSCLLHPSLHPFLSPGVSRAGRAGLQCGARGAARHFPPWLGGARAWSRSARGKQSGGPWGSQGCVEAGGGDVGKASLEAGIQAPALLLERVG